MTAALAVLPSPTQRNYFMNATKILTTLAAAIAMLVTTSAVQADLLYRDLFTAADGTYTASTSFTSPIGVSPLTTYGGTIVTEIDTNQLSLDDGGASPHEGLSFGGTATPYNWATSPAATDIENGGLFIQFDMAPPSGGDYISIGFGPFDGVPDGGAGFGAIYDSSNMDWGIRWENDRMISFLADGTTTPSFRTDQDGGAYAVGNGDYLRVLLELQFGTGGFDNGTIVTASSTVTDLTTNTIVSDLPDFDTFNLSATDDFRFDFSVNQTQGGGRVFFDNLVISSISPAAIPEPGALSMLSLGMFGLVARRRRKK